MIRSILSAILPWVVTWKEPPTLHPMVGAIVSALETECECSDWKSKLVGLSADGPAVNMGVRSGAARQSFQPNTSTLLCT